MSLLHAIPGIVTQQSLGGGGGATLTLVGAAAGTATGPSAINVSLPGGSASGDLCVAAVVNADTGTATPSGFTLLSGAPWVTAPSEIRGAYKTLTGTDISNGYVALPGDPYFNHNTDIMWVLHSTAGTPTIDVHTGTSGAPGTTPNTVAVIPSVTTTVADTIVLVATMTRSTTASYSTSIGTHSVDFNANDGHNLYYAAHFTKAVAGATGAENITNNASFGRYASMTVAVRNP